MEFPDDVLTLIRAFSRPRVSAEALAEYKRAGDWPELKRVMVTPQVIASVRAYNDHVDKIHAIYAGYRDIPILSPEAAHIRDQLDILFPIMWSHIRGLHEMIKMDPSRICKVE